MAKVKGRLNIAVVGEQAEAGARKGLRKAAKHVLQVSNTRVPNETGDLERSGRAEVDDANLRAAIGYGEGPSEPYAVVQHEALEFKHSNGRQAKFLESALTGEAGTCRDLIATAVRRALR